MLTWEEINSVETLLLVWIKPMTTLIQTLNQRKSQFKGVTPDVNLRNLLCAGEEAYKQGNPPWL